MLFFKKIKISKLKFMLNNSEVRDFAGKSEHQKRRAARDSQDERQLLLQIEVRFGKGTARLEEIVYTYTAPKKRTAEPVT